MKRCLSLQIGLLCMLHAQSADGIFDITDFGAVADTTQLSTSAIQKAVDACINSGGGTVLVPAGDYKVGTIVLGNHVDFHLSPGVTLYASRDMRDFTHHIKSGAADMDMADVIFLAKGAENISVTGPGRIHCRAVREQYRREPQLEVTDSVTGREIANAIKYGADYQSKYRKVPPCPGAINFTECKNVRIRDFTVEESSGWGVHLKWCEDVVADGLTILSSGKDGVNSDGLDIDGCEDVRISDCLINTGDDALCLKTTSENGESRPCKWITVTGCILTSSSAALKLGTESHSGFENVIVSNCLIKDANRGICMIIRDGGKVENVLFSDIVINTVRKATFWWGNGDPVWLTIQHRGDAYPGGAIKNVNFTNIIAHGQSGVRLEGFDGPIDNVRFKGFQLYMEPENAVDKRARNGFLFDKVSNLSLSDCDVYWNAESPEPAWESAYRFDNVNGLRLDDVRGASAPGSAFDALQFNNSER